MIANSIGAPDLVGGSPRLGLVPPTYGPQLSRQNLLGALQAAESAGFESAWTTDHIAVPDEQVPIYGDITEALISLAFVAGVTSRIQLGVSALVVPPREPLLMLKQVMSLDYLSGGRVALCVAAGWTEREFQNLGSNLRGRGRRLDDWLQLLEAAWAAAPGRLDFKQGGIEIEDAYLGPAPVANRLELWGAGHSPAAIARAARLGTWHPVSRPLQEVERLAAEFRALRPDGQVMLRIEARVQREPERSCLDSRGRSGIAGPPEWVAEKLSEYLAAGCDGFTLSLGEGSPSLAERIALFAQEVRPLLAHPRNGGPPRIGQHVVPIRLSSEEETK